MEGRAGKRRVTSCLHGEGGTEGRAAFGVHAHASATAIHAALTPPWEVVRIPFDRGQDIYCYPLASPAISTQRLSNSD